MSTSKETISGLKTILPQLESEGEDIRRCLSVIIENFHASNRRLEVMEKMGKVDHEAVKEFLVAAHEVGKSLIKLSEAARMIEIATNEMVKGAQGLADGVSP